jgi:hypothetical protein
MDRTRRGIIGAAAAATAGILFPGNVFGVEEPETLAVPPEARRSSWMGRRGATFTVERPGGRRVELRLRAVEDLATASATGLGGHECAFSLLFEGPRRSALSQGMYDVWGFGFGALALFLVPVEQARARQLYEVVFNNAIS